MRRYKRQLLALGVTVPLIGGLFVTGVTPASAAPPNPCPPHTGPPPHCAVLKNLPGTEIPKGATKPVHAKWAKVTVQKLGFGPMCSLEESLEAVYRTTYVGYIYIDAKGKKFDKKYATWTYADGNTTVSGPYTVLKTIKHHPTCLTDFLTGG